MTSTHESLYQLKLKVTYGLLEILSRTIMGFKNISIENLTRKIKNNHLLPPLKNRIEISKCPIWYVFIV